MRICNGNLLFFFGRLANSPPQLSAYFPPTLRPNHICDIAILDWELHSASGHVGAKRCRVALMVPPWLGFQPRSGLRLSLHSTFETFQGLGAYVPCEEVKASCGAKSHNNLNPAAPAQHHVRPPQTPSAFKFENEMRIWV